MVNQITAQVLKLLAIILLQVLILNNIQVGGFINPYVYPYFLMLLPIDFSVVGLLFIAFFSGLTVDLFCGTPGMHTAATLSLAYARQKVLLLLSRREKYELGVSPSVQRFGIQWFLSYLGMLTLLHHFVLFVLESFRWTEWLDILLKTLLSTLFSLLLMLVGYYLFQSKKRL